MEILRQFIFAIIATFFFSKYFNVERLKILFPAALAGGTAWLVYKLTFNITDSKVIGTFLGAFAVGIIGEFLSRKLRVPATILITPGIIPLVPGAGMYYTMLHFINNDFNNFFFNGTETILISAAIAIGILVASIFSRPLKRIRQEKY